MEHLAPIKWQYNISINFGDDSDEGERYKLISNDQWENIEWKSMEFSFRGCTNMTYMATDIPDLSHYFKVFGVCLAIV
ncbi:MAG: hypothetical protein R2766_10135 [Saprospiraceae bacterium]